MKPETPTQTINLTGLEVHNDFCLQVCNAEIESLRQRLAAALAACKAKSDMLSVIDAASRDARVMVDFEDVRKALAIQPDDSALQAYTAKVRDQCAHIVESQDVDPAFKHRMADAIRSITELPK